MDALRGRLQWAWWGLTGRAQKLYIDAIDSASKAWVAEQEAIQRAYQIIRDMEFAKAAISELKSQLPADYEAKRKVASDELGNSIIKDIQNNPKKYLPDQNP